MGGYTDCHQVERDRAGSFPSRTVTAAATERHPIQPSSLVLRWTGSFYVKETVVSIDEQQEQHSCKKVVSPITKKGSAVGSPQPLITMDAEVIRAGLSLTATHRNFPTPLPHVPPRAIVRNPQSLYLVRELRLPGVRTELCWCSSSIHIVDACLQRRRRPKTICRRSTSHRPGSRSVSRYATRARSNNFRRGIRAATAHTRKRSRRRRSSGP